MDVRHAPLDFFSKKPILKLLAKLFTMAFHLQVAEALLLLALSTCTCSAFDHELLNPPFTKAALPKKLLWLPLGDSVSLCCGSTLVCLVATASCRVCSLCVPGVSACHALAFQFSCS